MGWWGVVPPGDTVPKLSCQLGSYLSPQVSLELNGFFVTFLHAGNSSALAACTPLIAKVIQFHCYIHLLSIQYIKAHV